MFRFFFVLLVCNLSFAAGPPSKSPSDVDDDEVQKSIDWAEGFIPSERSVSFAAKMRDRAQGAVGKGAICSGSKIDLDRRAKNLSSLRQVMVTYNAETKSWFLGEGGCKEWYKGSPEAGGVDLEDFFYTSLKEPNRKECMQRWADFLNVYRTYKTFVLKPLSAVKECPNYENLPERDAEAQPVSATS